MKMVFALIQPFKLEDVTQRLETVPGLTGITVSEVRGFGREHLAATQRQREEEIEEFTEKIQIETIVSDAQVDAVVHAIATAAHTGRDGDGLIAVLPVERTLRIATFETGMESA